jgi:HK97 family phage major capsid protein
MSTHDAMASLGRAITERARRYSEDSLPRNPNELKKLKHESKEAALKIHENAAGRDLSEAEKIEYNKHVALAQGCSEALERHAIGATFGPELPDAPRFPGVAQFILDGEGGIQSSLAEGGTLAYVVPGWEVQNFVTAYPAIDPFGQAGATIIDTDDGHTLKIPIITQGANVGTFSELSGPSSAQDAGVYVASLEATKYSFLTKLSEEAAADIPALERTLSAEGVRRVFNSVSKAVTAALISSLTSANAIVDLTGDYLETLLTMEAAIDPTWASTGNVWMMDRSSLSRFRNTRDLQDRPIFDPVSGNLHEQTIIKIGEYTANKPLSKST